MDEDDVDCDLRQCQNEMENGYARLSPFDPWSVNDLRRVTEIVRKPWTEGGPIMKRIEEKHLGDDSVRIRIYYPNDENILPGLIYIHGGGWTLFSIDTHDRLMREYAFRANIIVIGVDYSLSPEVKYPQAINEIISVIHWIRNNNSKDFLIDQNRILIGGDSAGANLSVATNLRLRSLNEQLLSGQILNYGGYDRPNLQLGSYKRFNGPKYRLNSDEINFFQKNYVRDEKDFEDPLVFPLHADLEGLPSTLMIIAECDILADENKLMANALRQANVQVEERIYAGATHSFLELMKVASISNQALDHSVQWIKQLFNH